MKFLFTVFLLQLLFPCCTGNREKKQPDILSDTFTQEKEMLDIIARFPDSLLLRENLIQYYRDSSKYDKALEETNRAIRKDSNNASLWNINATLHFEDGDTLNAIRALERALSLDPDPRYLTSLATLYAETRNGKALKLADVLLREKNEKTL